MDCIRNEMSQDLQSLPSLGSQDLILTKSQMTCLEESIQEMTGATMQNSTPQSLHACKTEKDFECKEEDVHAPEDEMIHLPAQLPSNEQFSGDYNFQITINLEKNGPLKSTVLYSKHLNKVFLNIGQTLPVQFNWTPHRCDLVVRAMVVFASPIYAAEPISCCYTHRSEIYNKDIDRSIVHHVIRCHNINAEYFGLDDGRQHLSVTVPLGVPQPGAQSVVLLYKFACKNSCSSGMNRRPIECVFTLETMTGVILGRQSIATRICSCPKRDKNKEENDRVKLHKSNAGTPKLIKSKTDTNVYELSVNIVGLHNYKDALHFIFNSMAGDLYRTNETGVYQKHLAAIESEIDAAY